MTPTPEQLAEWNAWLAGRPENVRAVAERYPPFNYYRLTTTGQLGQIKAYGEPGAGCEMVTVRMLLCQEGAGFMAPLMTREVFGIDPADLVMTDKEPDYLKPFKVERDLDGTPGLWITYDAPPSTDPKGD